MESKEITFLRQKRVLSAAAYLKPFLSAVAFSTATQRNDSKRFPEGQRMTTENLERKDQVTLNERRKKNYIDKKKLYAIGIVYLILRLETAFTFLECCFAWRARFKKFRQIARQIV